MWRHNRSVNLSFYSQWDPPAEPRAFIKIKLSFTLMMLFHVAWLTFALLDKHKKLKLTLVFRSIFRWGSHQNQFLVWSLKFSASSLWGHGDFCRVFDLRWSNCLRRFVVDSVFHSFTLFFHCSSSFTAFKLNSFSLFPFLSIQVSAWRAVSSLRGVDRSHFSVPSSDFFLLQLVEQQFTTFVCDLWLGARLNWIPTCEALTRWQVLVWERLYLMRSV